MRFLIVDDSEASQFMLGKFVESMGHQVAAKAGNGEEAVAAYVANRPDAVIMDLIMPKMNGQEALRAIRTHDPGARVVMISSMRSPQTALACKEDGASYFLFKPVRLEEFRNVIEKLLEEISPSPQ
ncbi:MAG: response regulator [Deltaproteobacteria bacterium]|nr:response regulator [Deltaproteobacteria bacterium]